MSLESGFDRWRVAGVLALQRHAQGTDVFSFFFTTPLAPGRLGSLIDFDGGAIFQGTLAGPGIGTSITGFSGSLTRAVPEPAVLGMFGAGVLLLGLFAGLRRRFN